MPSLFKSLFKLQLRNSKKPKEDYLTEIFTFCLKENIEFLSDFLSTFSIHEGIFTSAKLTSQFTLSALDGHETDSRPDIAIFLDKKVIFIENKIDSGEGYLQLQRYAEHLDQYSLSRVLVYITRDYDPKDITQITKRCQSDVDFIQIRWYDIYNFLKKYTSITLINQLSQFMQELGLSSSNQFNPTDIIALNNFSRVRKMMNETMYGEVEKKFTKLAKGISHRNAAMAQIRTHDRYIYFSGQKHSMWVGLGYFLNSFNEKHYPDVVFRIEVGPNSEGREEIIKAFKEKAAKDNTWIGYGLNDPTSWASLNKIQGLHYFLNGENHIENIKSYFLNSLDEFDKFKKEYAHLPWKEE